jgi:phthalate 4,5-cis-dihydrodiol dehydrogenase
VTAPLRLGVAGLGRAFMLMLPTLAAHSRVKLAAASDPREEARRKFEAQFGARTHATVEALCADPDVDAVYIATPHELHAEHVALAARHGKHALVEKPMAITLAECAAMIEAARAAGIALVIGHSHSFDAPVLRTRELIASGRFGDVRMITAMNYTDFLYRPRRPEELDTSKGGGVVFSQGAHQVDVVRLLAGGKAISVRAHTGAWDRARPTEGAYSAQLAFANGAFASLVYNGYGHFDSDEFVDWIGELGHPRDRTRYGAARAALRGVSTAAGEAALKNQRAYGKAAASTATPVAHNHFGLLVATCDRADLRPTATGVRVYDDEREWVEELPAPAVPRAEVLDEFCDAIAGVRPAVHSGEWAMATLEVCLAILESARSGRDVALLHQIAAPGG